MTMALAAAGALYLWDFFFLALRLLTAREETGGLAPAGATVWRAATSLLKARGHRPRR